ncbi:hypothetical protein DFH09DRAFT_1449233, partial [Mycena vulgaris]
SYVPPPILAKRGFNNRPPSHSVERPTSPTAIMNLSSLIFLILGPVVVRAQASGPPQVNIVDFQGNVFDLANFNQADLTPVQTLQHGVGDTAQLWTLIPAGAGTLFTIQNIDPEHSFLSFTTAGTTVDPICAQICAHRKIGTVWNITFNADVGGYNIIETKSKYAIQSWARASSNPANLGFSTPLTLQPFIPTQVQ